MRGVVRLDEFGLRQSLESAACSNGGDAVSVSINNIDAFG